MRKVIPIREEFARFREPTLAEMLSDPIVKAVMRADSVDPERLVDMLDWISDERRADLPASSRKRGDFEEQRRPLSMPAC